MRSAFSQKFFVASTALAASALVACSGGSQASVGASTSADTAHLAAQAAEPRTGDATASREPGPVPTSTTPLTVGSKSSPPPSPTERNERNENAASATPPTPPAQPSRSGSSDREEDPKRIGARHVLVQWMGSDRAGKSVLRTKEQALVLAQEVLKRARAGEDLGRLANEYSDEPNAGARGGSLGRFSKGQMVGAFEAVAFKLKVGEISDIVETPFGYHIIQRTE